LKDPAEIKHQPFLEGEEGQFLRKTSAKLPKTRRAGKREHTWQKNSRKLEENKKEEKYD